MLNWLSEKLFPGETNEDAPPTPVTTEVGTAALLIEAAHRDGSYTEIERDLVITSMMKLFGLTNVEALAVCRDAENAQKEAAYVMRFAVAAQKLDADTKEKLITQLWAIIDSDDEIVAAESELIEAVIDVLGISPERARALRLPSLSLEK